MTEFLDAAARYSFVQHALLAGVLASIACGVVGTYVVVRRITYIAGGISHCVLGGIGAAVYFQQVHGWAWLTPLVGAIAAALAAALIIGLVSLRAKQREDTVIGALWAIGMAVGVLFIAKTPGYAQDLMSYLFGNILMVAPADLWLIAALDALVVALGLAFYNQFLAVCFDEEFARVRGLRVEFYYLLLLGLTALTVVLLVTVVGIVLVIALLTLPVAVAGHFARRLWQMMALATVFSTIFTTLGLAISYKPDLPAGATVIVLAGAAYLGVLLASRAMRGRI
ncbi:MAG: metal ABC transporter permease [Planctomycetes bacterium]|nr:metal ABC transporter permease [Planctomycetota bacterium]